MKRPAGQPRSLFRSAGCGSMLRSWQTRTEVRPVFVSGVAGETPGACRDVIGARADRAAAVRSQRAQPPDSHRGLPARCRRQTAVRAPSQRNRPWCVRRSGGPGHRPGGVPPAQYGIDPGRHRRRHHVHTAPAQGPGPPASHPAPAGSTLSFRVGANGPVGMQYTAYVLKLRDNATGKEVYAGAFGRRKVQQACQAQGWSFSRPGSG
jgi:hypothetical protein